MQKTAWSDHATGSGDRSRSVSARPQRRKCSIVRADVVFGSRAQPRDLVTAFDHDAGYSVVRKLHCGGETDRSPAGYEYRRGRWQLRPGI